MPYYSTFGLTFQKGIVIFEISTLEFVKTQKFVQNKKKIKFDIKTALVWNF